MTVTVLTTVASFVLGVLGIVVGWLAGYRTRQAQERRKASRSAEYKFHHGEYRIRIAVSSLVDPTGESVYAAGRQMLTTRSSPDGSPSGSFHAATRLLADTYDEATQDEQQTQ